MIYICGFPFTLIPLFNRREEVICISASPPCDVCCRKAVYPRVTINPPLVEIHVRYEYMYLIEVQPPLDEKTAN